MITADLRTIGKTANILWKLVYPQLFQLLYLLTTAGLYHLFILEAEKEKLPPLITAEIPDSIYFVVDDPEYKIQLDCKAEGSEPITYVQINTCHSNL